MFLSLKRSSTLPSSNASGNPTFTFDGGSERTLGNRNRTVPSVRTAVEAVSSAQATPIHVSRKKRRSAPFFAGGLATGAAGLGGGAWTAVAEAGGGGLVILGLGSDMT